MGVADTVPSSVDVAVGSVAAVSVAVGIGVVDAGSKVAGGTLTDPCTMKASMATTPCTGRIRKTCGPSLRLLRVNWSLNS